MNLPKILGEKDPGQFTNKRVRIYDRGGYIDAMIAGEPMSFEEMMKYRSEKIGAQEIQNALSGKGYLAANLGLSMNLSTTIKGQDYCIVVMQYREDDFKDYVGKLISGYIPYEKLTNPLSALDDEASEEVVLVTNEGRILPGFRDLNPLPKPFENVVQYEDRLGFQMYNVSPNDYYEQPGMLKKPLFIDGREIFPKPSIYFQLPSHSAQMVFNYHLDLPDVLKDLRHAELSVALNHSEDKFNPKSKKLEVMLHEMGPLLIEIENKELTDRVFNYIDGALVPISDEQKSGLCLSEAFSPKEKGIVCIQNVSFGEYLRSRKS